MHTLEEEKETTEKEKPSMKNMMERLLEARTLTIFGEIDTKLAQDICQKLLILDADSDDPIKIFINTPGGHVESGDTIYDMIRFVNAPVKVIGTGWVASAGALIYVAPPKENRFCLPNTRFLLHQPMGGIGGQAADVEIHAQEILKIRQQLDQLLADDTGQPLEQIARDTDRDFYLSPEQALEYGLVDEILTGPKAEAKA